MRLVNVEMLVFSGMLTKRVWGYVKIATNILIESEVSVWMREVSSLMHCVGVWISKLVAGYAK